MRKGSDLAAVALLALVASVHYGYEPLAAWLHPDRQQQAARAIFYVARGFEGAALYVAVWAFAPRRLPIMVACLWGGIESAQTSVCRLALGIGSVAPEPSPYRGLCDLATGSRVSVVTAVMALLVVAIVQECVHGKRGD